MKKDTLRPLTGRRLPRVGAAITLSAIFLTGCASSPSDTEGEPSIEVNMTSGTTSLSSSLMVATSENLFDFPAPGGNANLQTFPIANDGAQLMLAGQMDSAALAELPLVNYIAKGADIVSVGVIVVGRDIDLVIGSDVKSPEDLKGKRIGYAFGTGLEYAFSAYLKQIGMSPSDVEPVNVQNSDVVAVLARGDIDGFVGVGRLTGQAIAQMGDSVHLLTPRVSDAYQTRQHLVFRRTWAEQHPEAVTAILKGLIDAGNFIEEKPDEAAQAPAELLKLTPEQVQAEWSQKQIDFTPHIDQAALDVLKETAAWLQASGKIENVDLTNAVDASYLRAADASLVKVDK